MSEIDLKKLNRKELLELLLKASRENEELRADLSDAREEQQSLQEQLANAESKNAELTVRVEDLEVQLAGMTRSRDEAEAQLDGLAADQEESKADIQKQMDRLIEMGNILGRATERLDAAEKRLQETVRKQENRLAMMEKSGSLAEASLRVSGVFLDAQQTAEKYLGEIRKRALVQENTRNEMMENSRKQCEDMKAAAEAECSDMKAKAKQEADTYWAQLSGKMDEYSKAHESVSKLLSAFNIRTKAGQPADKQ